MFETINTLKAMLESSYENYLKHLTLFDYIIYFIGIIIIVMLIDVIYKVLRDAVRREKFNPKLKQSPFMKIVVAKHMKYKNHKYLGRVQKYMASKYMAFNNGTVETNEYAATITIYVMTRVYSLLYLALLLMNQLWYVTIAAIILLTITFSVFFFMLGSIANTLVDNMLPELSKMLANRYANSNSIITAIELTRTDYTGAMRRELDKIYNALKLNDKSSTKLEFQSIKNQYNNRNFSMLVDLIYQAYYRGNREQVIGSFTEARALIQQANLFRRKITRITRPLMVFSIFFIISGILGMNFSNSKLMTQTTLTAMEEQNRSISIVVMLIIEGVLLIYLGLQERSNQI